MSWLALLSPSAQILFIIALFVLILLVIGLIAFISIKSKIDLKIAGQEVSIGKDNIIESPTPIQSISQPQHEPECDHCTITTDTSELTVFPSRSCGDCIRILRNQSHVTERKIRRARREAMEQKMLFVDHKSDEIQERIFSSFNRQNQSDPNDSTIIPNLFLGRLELSINVAKSEIRRSFKENGFHEKEGSEYKEYLITETTAILTKVKRYLRSNYPTSQVKISLEQIDQLVDNEYDSISLIIKSIYDNAKRLDLDAEQKIDLYEKEYEDKTEKFITFKEGGDINEQHE